MNLKIFQNATQKQILMLRDAFFGYSQRVLDRKYFTQVFNNQQRVIPMLIQILKNQMYDIQPLYWNFLQKMIKKFNSTTLLSLQQGNNKITNFDQFSGIFYGIFKWYKIAQQLSQKIGINIFLVIQKICRQFNEKTKLITIIQKQGQKNVYLKNFLISLFFAQKTKFDLIKAATLINAIVKYRNTTNIQNNKLMLQEDTGRIILQNLQPISIIKQVDNDKSIQQQFQSFLSHNNQQNESFYTVSNKQNSYVNYYSIQQRQQQQNKQQSNQLKLISNIGLKIQSLKKDLQLKQYQQQLPIKKIKLQPIQKQINLFSHTNKQQNLIKKQPLFNPKKSLQTLGQNSTIIGNQIISKSIPISLPNQKQIHQKIKQVVSSSSKIRFIPKIQLNQKQKQQLKTNILLYEQLKEKQFKKLFNQWYQGSIKLQGFQQQVFQLIAQYYVNPKTIQYYDKKLSQIIKGNNNYKWQPINSKPIGMQNIGLILLQNQRLIDPFNAFPKTQQINYDFLY